jgi:hypothetical protein
MVTVMGGFSFAGTRGQSVGSPSPEALEILGDDRKGGIKELTARNHDCINAQLSTTRKVLPEHLSNQSISSISRDRPPKLPRSHDSEAG